MIAVQFNGMQELMSRPDGAQKLLEQYTRSQALSFSFDIDENNGFCDFTHLELMLSQPEFYNKLNDNSLTLLENTALNNYEREIRDQNFDSPTMFYRVLKENNMSSLYSLNFGPALDGGTKDGYTATTYTPNGTKIYAYHYTEMSQACRDRINSWMSQTYPNAIKLGEPTWNYNCHTYAWWKPNTTGQYWIEDPSPYWKDGSYIPISVNNYYVGDKVVYPSDHSAIVAVKNSNYTISTLKSKWGAFGLYQHKLVDCPYWTGSVAFYHR